MNDLIRLSAEEAAENFNDPSDNIFNAANFSNVFIRHAGVTNNLDGKIVRAMLTGRPDIEILDGGAHFRVIKQ